MSKRLLLHVGTPKTGTSRLQDVLFRNRPRLAEAGVLYPADRFDAHFLAALDLMRLPWGGLEREAVGRWDRLAEQVREHRGTAIVSHEILAAASRSHVERAMESLGAEGHGGSTEVHVVLSVRDLVRQVPAEWQENVKHRSTLTYARFLDELRRPERSTRTSSWFWAVQDLPDVLDRWASSVPPERVHLITVPPAGAAPDVLWERFRRAFGLDALDLEVSEERANPSMGVPETALLRRLNEVVVPRVAPADYRPLVRELLAHRTLSARTGTARLGLPPELLAWARDLGDAWVEELGRRGYQVEGDLEDLRGVEPPADHRWVDPDHPPEREVSAAALDAVTAAVEEAVRLRREGDALRAEVEDLRHQLHRAHLRPTYRLREKAVRRLSGSRGGRAALRAYRRARGRSSRSA